MPNLSKEEACNFIAEVREDNGGITAYDREFLEAHRPSALRALKKTRRQLADSIKIVVDNLYSKETRFLYELIQNAEDNSYSLAAAKGEKPFLAFKVYPDRIIIDSNEDGFSESNIKAICSVGDSTKKHSAGYIGEKGIGFKSVFKIAQKVHIQSGPFSFAFSHTREDDDDGLGMITPYYEDAEELATGVRTRMTLTLLDSTKFEERASEFRRVPDTLLMFLNQLKRLSIELYQPNKAPTATQYSKQENKESGLYTTFLVKTARKGKEESTSEQKYYAMKSDLRDLPFDEARKDKQGNSIDQATVVLAFPVDEHDEPILEQQYTYAFLPLRRAGFKFLIQSDFVTQANREDVVHSERNQAVLKGVAKAFTDAMAMFCKLPSLRYQWMRYLPEGSISDEFWSTLWTLIREKLEQTPLLKPWSGKGLYKPSKLEKLSERLIDRDGNPLLPDLEGAEVYLSPKYTEEDFQILKRLGTVTLQWSKFVDRLYADLHHSSGSKWRYMKNNTDWRTRICELLSRAFIGKSQNLANQQKRLRTLDLIPLYDGRWVSSTSGIKVYFPKTADISIPTDLGLDLVHPIAVENVAWSDLLSTLGLMNCSSDAVVSSIYKRYNATNFDNFNMFNAVAHIRYLYWFLPKGVSRLAPQVRLANQHGSLLRKDQYLYFPDGEDDNSPPILFKQDALHPGHPVHYLHGDYLKAVDPGVIHNGRPWTRWLEEIAEVRQIPVLCAPFSDELSKEFQYIITYRSDRLLRTLKRGWPHYRPLINNFVEEKLWNSAVLLENGRRTSLQSTVLPLPKLKQIVAELRIAEAYPFVAMSELLQDEERIEWTFVKDLRVEIEENLYFYLSALETFKRINPALNTTSAGDQLTKIYENIQSKCSEDLDAVRDMFKHPVIWIQPSNRTDSTWVSSVECVWGGPQWLKSKQCLKHNGYLELEPLFKVSLRIPDASQADVIDDLLMLKGYMEDENASRSQSTPNTSRNVGLWFGTSSSGTAGAPYQATPMEPNNGTTDIFQSINCMKAYKNWSFEVRENITIDKHDSPTYSFKELRLVDYDAGRRPLSTKFSVYKSKAFAGLETDKIMDEAEKRYDYLWQKHSSLLKDKNLESWKALRFTFEDSSLVYIPKENAWFPPSKCIWSESNVKIPGKASIASAYPLKKTFFTTVLKVLEPTVEMYVESLKAEARGKASAAKIKETMALICGLGFEEAELSSLVEAKVLPIKLANGEGSLASASSKDESVDFAIVENAAHWNAFKGKIAALDFSLEEIRDVRPLLLAMGLGNQFSSRLVNEVTDVSGGSQDHEITRNLRIKSQAIVRCAFHFSSLNKRQTPALLYQKFKHAMVYVSNGIRRSLQITQNRRSIEGASSRANFHFEETDGALRLYLPKDEVERDVCFESDLPRKLCVFLGITDSGAPGVIGGVFRKDNPAVIDKILENAGVSQVDCDFAALDEELGAPEDESDVETLAGATSNIRLSTPSSGPRSYTPSGWATWRERQSGSTNAEDVRGMRTPSPSYQERQREAQETAYRSILENVVNVARQRVHSGFLESTGVSIQGSMATKALPQENIRDAFLARTLERDFKLGAAGELYVFEYLKGLLLPGFGLDNWKSAIRDRVNIHADYHDLEKDNDRSAIADIEYLDHSGRFTQFLTQKGHLAPGLCDSERLLYHIEVKTTTSSDWQEPFFMSKHQERHVQDKRIENGKSPSSIYIICRIFNLGKGDETGVHIYLDPETKRRNRELEFSTHTWAVRPLSHPYMPASNRFGRASAARTTEIVATTAKINGETGTNDARRESVVPGYADFGSSATNSVPSSNNMSVHAVSTDNLFTLPSTTGTFNFSTLGSQKKTESSNNTADATNGSKTLNLDSTSSSLPKAMNRTTSTRAVSTGSLFNIPASGGSLFGTSRPLSPGHGLFGANTTSSNNNASTQSSLPSSPFGTIKPSSTAGGFSGFKGVYPSSDTSKTPSPGQGFSSHATSFDNDVSKATPTGGLFGSTVMSANDNISKASSTGNPFGTTANSEVPKGTSSIAGFSRFGSSGSTTSNAPSTKGLFRIDAGALNGRSSSAPSASGLFGTKAVPSNIETMKTTSSTYPFGIAKPSSSSTTGGSFGTKPSSSATGGLFSTNPSSLTTGGFGTGPFSSTTGGSIVTQPSSSTTGGSLFTNPSSSTTGGLFGTNLFTSTNQTPKTTATSNSTGAVKPSSSILTGAVFGTIATSTQSERSQGATSFETSSTPSGGFGTNATTSCSHDTSKGTPNIKFSFSDQSSGLTKPMPTASNLFGSAFVSDDLKASRERSAGTAFGSTSITETANSSKPTMSNAPSVLTSADSPPTYGLFAPKSLQGKPIQSNDWLHINNPFANPSPSPSPTPTPKPGSPQAPDTKRSEGSPKPAAAGMTAGAAETQPAATRNGASGETQTDNDKNSFG